MCSTHNPSVCSSMNAAPYCRNTCAYHVLHHQNYIHIASIPVPTMCYIIKIISILPQYQCLPCVTSPKLSPYCRNTCAYHVLHHQNYLHIASIPVPTMCYTTKIISILPQYQCLPCVTSPKLSPYCLNTCAYQVLHHQNYIHITSIPVLTMCYITKIISILPQYLCLPRVTSPKRSPYCSNTCAYQVLHHQNYLHMVQYLLTMETSPIRKVVATCCLPY